MNTPSFSAIPLRAGDRERERAADVLGGAFAQGYLSMTEYEARLAETFAAVSAERIAHLIGDLPVRQIIRNDPRRRAARAAAARRGVHVHLLGYLALVALTVTVWLIVGLTAGAWYFWPIWPALGGAVGLISHAIPVRACAGHRRPSST